jgi:hypothetical protein
MRILKIVFKLSLILGIFLLIAGLFMKLYNVESQGWFFTKRGDLIHGVLDANGTLVLGFIILVFSIWNKRSFSQEKQKHERLKNIEKNEELLRKKYDIFKLRKVNKN